MQILVLSPYPPYPPRSGGALRIYNILIELASHHKVTLLTFVPDHAAAAALEPLRTHCNVVVVDGMPRRSAVQRALTTLFSPLPDMALRNTSAAYTSTMRQLVHEHHYDIVQAESIEMARYGVQARMAAFQNGSRPPAIVLDEFNAEYMLQQRAALIGLGDMRTWFVNRFRPHPRNTTAIQRVTSLVAPFYSLVQASKLAAYEQWLLHTYNHVVVVSEDDRQALRRLFESPHLSVVPNGVDVRYFSPETASLSKEQRDSPPLLVFTGTLDFRPNVDAVMWFASHVLPTIRFRYPGARFVVVGRSPAPAVRDLHDGTSIEVIGDVDDVRPFIALADVYVVPMRIGGGVRLKVLEALAMQAPLVSTTLGAEGIPELREDEHLLLADTPDDFAGAILRLLGNPAEGQRMGETGRALVSTFYDWQVVVPQFDAIYNQTNGFC